MSITTTDEIKSRIKISLADTEHDEFIATRILGAEAFILAQLNNDFTDDEGVTTDPHDLKDAVADLILDDLHNSLTERRIESESIGNYSVKYNSQPGGRKNEIINRLNHYRKLKW